MASLSSTFRYYDNEYNFEHDKFRWLFTSHLVLTMLSECWYVLQVECFLFLDNRDPKKRKVKPVESHLLQWSFGGLDDSDEDSDFDFKGIF